MGCEQGAFSSIGLILAGAFIGSLALYLYLRKSGRLPNRKGGTTGTVGGGGGRRED